MVIHWACCHPLGGGSAPSWHTAAKQHASGLQGHPSSTPNPSGKALRRADTQTPTRHSVSRTSTPTRKRFPHSTAHECLKALFRHASVFKTHRHAVYHCLKEVQNPFRHTSVFKTRVSANKGLPLPLGRGVCETKSKNGHSRPRKPFVSRVFCAQRGVETMVSDHGLGRGQTMG